MKLSNKKMASTISVAFIILFSCKRFIEVPAPNTDLTRLLVFSEDATATAAIIDIYAQIGNGVSYTNGTISSSLSFRAGLSSDELQLYSTSLEYSQYFNNDLIPTTSTINTAIWAPAYQHIYKANSLLEGIKNSDKITSSLKKRLEGEAKFFRAFSYFYLVNLFGGVPLALTSDYKINSTISRTPTKDIYQKIIQDCIESADLLDSNYLSSNNAITSDRFRVNKFTALALLARAYLFTEDFKNAEAISSQIINNSSMYSLQPLNSVFLKNSKEAIWQLGRDDGNCRDAATFIFPTLPINAALRSTFVNSFEPKDQRRVSWIGSRTSGLNTYFFPNKYKITALSPVTESSTVLRLAEIYLIRAEARIRTPGNLQNGIQDLNVLRLRASLPTPNNIPLLENTLSIEDAMIALEKERSFELFTELGHRWLDLKRWRSIIYPNDNNRSRADDILQGLKASWQKEDKLYPIPQIQISNNPSMANEQNPGYN